MSRFKTNLSRFSKRLKQQDIEEQTEPDSLSARAFRHRLLDEEINEPIPGNTTAPSQPRVAVYRPVANPLPRRLLRFGLVVVAPLLAIALILWITFTTIAQNQTTEAVKVESVFDSNVPVPAGVRSIPRAANYSQAKLAVEIYKRYLPTYAPVIRSVATYISPLSLDELNQYYKSRLVDPKPPPWQLYGKPATLGDQYTTFYIRSLNGQQSLEGLLVQLENIRQDTLRQDPSYYDKQAKPGETVITLSKAVLNQ